VEILALTLVRELSMLEEELESLTLEVWLVDMLALTLLSELSMLDELFERLLEAVLMAPSKASRLDDEFERLKLDVWLAETRPFVAVRAASTEEEEVESCTLEV